jgi:hypothetical protein
MRRPCSDLHPYHGREKGCVSRTIVGHEFVGTVVALGSQVHRRASRVQRSLSHFVGSDRQLTSVDVRKQPRVSQQHRRVSQIHVPRFQTPPASCARGPHRLSSSQASLPCAVPRRSRPCSWATVWPAPSPAAAAPASTARAAPHAGPLSFGLQDGPTHTQGMCHTYKEASGPGQPAPVATVAQPRPILPQNARAVAARTGARTRTPTSSAGCRRASARWAAGSWICIYYTYTTLLLDLSEGEREVGSCAPRCSTTQSHS